MQHRRQLNIKKKEESLDYDEDAFKYIERKVNIKEAKALFKDNFIGLNEIKSINNKLKINLPNKILS